MTIVTTYWFKPANHFNVVNEKVYNELSRFYGPEYFKVTEEQKDDAVSSAN